MRDSCATDAAGDVNPSDAVVARVEQFFTCSQRCAEGGRNGEAIVVVGDEVGWTDTSVVTDGFDVHDGRWCGRVNDDQLCVLSTIGAVDRVCGVDASTCCVNDGGAQGVVASGLRSCGGECPSGGRGGGDGLCFNNSAQCV